MNKQLMLFVSIAFLSSCAKAPKAPIGRPPISAEACSRIQYKTISPMATELAEGAVGYIGWIDEIDGKLYVGAGQTVQLTKPSRDNYAQIRRVSDGFIIDCKASPDVYKTKFADYHIPIVGTF